VKKSGKIGRGARRVSSLRACWGLTAQLQCRAACLQPPARQQPPCRPALPRSSSCTSTAAVPWRSRGRCWCAASSWHGMCPGSRIMSRRRLSFWRSGFPSSSRMLSSEIALLSMSFRRPLSCFNCSAIAARASVKSFVASAAGTSPACSSAAAAISPARSIACAVRCKSARDSSGICGLPPASWRRSLS
jgi:hypothetical protein